MKVIGWCPKCAAGIIRGTTLHIGDCDRCGFTWVNWKE